jgi:hypothetical protein
MHPLHLQMGRLVLIAGTALAATAARSRAAETVQLTPQRDNTIYENCSVPCPDGGSNGSGENVFAGRSGMLGLRRALLRFDVASAVPSGATVLGADLTVHVSSPAPGAPPVSVALHRLSADWGEGASDAGLPGGGGALPAPGDASWEFRFFDTTPWTGAGAAGDFQPLPSATASIGGEGFYTWTSTPDLVADVQTWLADPALNFGWLIIGNEAGGGGGGGGSAARRFNSRESPDPTLRPVLSITYESPPPVPAVSAPGAVLLAAILIAGLCLVARRTRA